MKRIETSIHPDGLSAVSRVLRQNDCHSITIELKPRSGQIAANAWRNAAFIRDNFTFRVAAQVPDGHEPKINAAISSASRLHRR